MCNLPEVVMESMILLSARDMALHTASHHAVCQGKQGLPAALEIRASRQ